MIILQISAIASDLIVSGGFVAAIGALWLAMRDSNGKALKDKDSEIEYLRGRVKELQKKNDDLHEERFKMMAELKVTLNAAVDTIKLTIQDDK